MPGQPTAESDQGATSPTTWPQEVTPQTWSMTKVHAATGTPAPPEGAGLATPTPLRTTRFLARVQMSAGSAPAPYALVATHTMSPNATPDSSGTAILLPLHKKGTKEPGSEWHVPATPSASTGTYPGRATPIHTPPGIAARAAATMTMVHKPADSHSPKPRTSTPLKADNWLILLHLHNLLDKYGHIPFSLQYGFNAGIKYIADTFTPPNDKSIKLYHDPFQQSIKNELAKGRYEGPLSQQQAEDWVGPFQTSLLSIIPNRVAVQDIVIRVTRVTGCETRHAVSGGSTSAHAKTTGMHTR